MMNYKYKLQFAVGLLPLLWSSAAFAEGNKVFTLAAGVNRVIRTQPGFKAVRGNYSLEFKSPRNETNEFETAADKANFAATLDPEIVIENRPSVYLGGTLVARGGNHGTSEIDGGIQLEIVTRRTVDSIQQVRVPQSVGQ